MRIAIFSDVHGNLSALEAVLADIEVQAVDHTIFAGDLCMVGPRPAACVERLQDADITALFGNTDDWLLGRQEPPAHLADLARWTHLQLSAEQRAWLDRLAFSHLVSPTGNPQNDLLVVHANPRDVNQLIFPSLNEQMERYGRVRQEDAVLEPLLEGLNVDVLAFGHLHVPFIRTWNNIQLVNISSVSMPGDADPHAKYGIFTWNGERWVFERRHVPYNVDLEVDAYRQARPPGWQNITRQIRSYGFYPQNV